MTDRVAGAMNDRVAGAMNECFETWLKELVTVSAIEPLITNR
ncbi:hypothetical protein [Dyadobacter aurulentus]|nr:hypothetical protein [Dyadobacter sp. UC 10]